MNFDFSVLNVFDHRITIDPTARRRILQCLDGLKLLLGIVAVTSLVAEHGFFLSYQALQIAWLSNIVVLSGFVVVTLGKILFVEHVRQFFRSHWFEVLLLLLILAHAFLPNQVSALVQFLNPVLKPESLTRWYLIITQLLVGVAFIPSAFRYSKKVMAMDIQPPLLIVLSFLFLIAAGTILLMLPKATVQQSLAPIDALFTATSAVCVTGLIVVDTATYFTYQGHLILMMLMQIGGLGIMTLTTFFAFVLGGGARLKEYATLQSLLGEEGLGRIKQTILQIASMTLLFEALGAIGIYYSINDIDSLQPDQRLFFSLFHSISAFCNAGFTLTTNNLAESFLQWNAGVLWTVMVLIVLGGLGFPVIANLGMYILPRPETSIRRRLSVHTKIVLVSTVALIVLGTAGLYLLEESNTHRSFSTSQKILVSLFHSISARTAGFNSLDIGALTVPTLFFLVFLMWIGASPGSTGGGIKTTAFTLSIMNIIALATGRDHVELFRKRIADSAVTRAFSTIILSMFFIATAFFLLLLTEPFPVQELLFEVVSAIGTVGLSTGITPILSDSGKMIIIFCMYVGRVGLFSLMLALMKRRIQPQYAYTEENVLVT